MEIGIRVPNWGTLSSPESILAVGKRADELEFDAIWVGDHVAVPISDTSPARDWFYEAISVLAYLAAITTRVRLGTNVLVLPYRHPMILAMELATVDCLSGGRLIFGAAAGWMEGEFEALGVPVRKRGAMTDEYLRIITELWARREPSFQGRFHSFSGIKFAPRPLQQPRPPIWIGGNSREAMLRAVRYGDVWSPLHLSAERVARRKAYLKELAEREGRQEGPAIAVSSSIAFTEGEASDERQLQGPPESIAEMIIRYAELGVSHMLFDFPRTSLKDILGSMETLAAKVRPLLPKA